MSSTNQLIRRAPSGPVVQYPTALAGNVLTVLPDGTLDPLPSAGGRVVNNIDELVRLDVAAGTIIRQVNPGLNWIAIPKNTAARNVTFRVGVGTAVDYELLTLPNRPPAIIGNQGWSPSDYEGSIVAGFEAADLPLGRLSTWNDYRYYAGSAFDPAIQATAARQPIVVDLNGQRWVHFDSESQNAKLMMLPDAVNTALTGTLFGNGFVIAYAMTYGPVIDSVFGAVHSPIFTARATSPDYIPNFLSGGIADGGLWGLQIQGQADAFLTRLGLRQLAYAPTLNYNGCENAMTVAFTFDATTMGSYMGGLWTKVAAPTGKHTFTEAAIGNSLHLLAGYIRSYYVCSGPVTLQDLNKFAAYFERNSCRRVVWDGNSLLWFPRPESDTPPNAGGGMALATEQLLATSRYQHDNRSIGTESCFDMQNRFWTETAQRLRPGDVYAFFEIFNSVNVGVNTTSEIIAQIQWLTDNAHKLGALVVVGTGFSHWGSLNPTQLATVVAINTAMRDGTIAADAIADLDTLPELQDTSNPIYFSQAAPAGVHLTALGCEIAATRWAVALNSVAPV